MARAKHLLDSLLFIPTPDGKYFAATLQTPLSAHTPSSKPQYACRRLPGRGEDFVLGCSIRQALDQRIALTLAVAQVGFGVRPRNMPGSAGLQSHTAASNRPLSGGQLPVAGIRKHIALPARQVCFLLPAG